MSRDITGLKETILATPEKSCAHLIGLRSSLDLFREHHNSIDNGTVSLATYDKLDAKLAAYTVRPHSGLAFTTFSSGTSSPKPALRQERQAVKARLRGS